MTVERSTIQKIKGKIVKNNLKSQDEVEKLNDTDTLVLAVTHNIGLEDEEEEEIPKLKKM
ncbi:MAG: hypothetical protein L0I79_02635 [Atopostipes sp.]|nr:hypothetical protein [Atopostipes sp.]